MSGVFIVLEGVDGCGKSTQARRLLARLQGAGRQAVHVREPGATAAGERIRELLLDPGSGDIVPVAEMFLYQAARAQLVAEVVRPALGAGQDVICERWHYATSAYQGIAGGVGLEPVRVTSGFATGGLEPHRAVLLDLPGEVADGRLGELLDRMESKGPSFRGRVAAALRDLFADEGPDSTLRTVSAEGSPDEVEARVWKAVRDLF